MLTRTTQCNIIADLRARIVELEQQDNGTHNSTRQPSTQ